MPPIGSPLQPRSHGLGAGLIQLSTNPVGAAEGRHDPGVLTRAVPMAEAMVALVRADHLLRQQGQCSLW